MISVKGLVVGERFVGETGKSVSLLTEDFGCIEVFVRGGRKSKKSISTTQLFSYSEFSLEEKRSADGSTQYYYGGAEPITLFYNIRLDAKKTALAFYLADLLKYSLGSGEDVMRLALNTFYYMNKGSRSCEQLKSIFELRLLCETGYMPALAGCHVCYRHLAPEMHFNIKTGQLSCPEHAEGADALYDVILDRTQLYTVRYIALSEMEALFSFRLSGEYLEWLSGFTERFVEFHYGRRFETLKFYKMME